MKALLFATGHQLQEHPFFSSTPSPMLKVINRPIIVLIIEYLIGKGIRDFTLFLHHLPEVIEEEVGDGERWGVRIQTQLIKDPEAPFGMVIPIIEGWSDSHLLIGQGDLLPSLSQGQLDTFKPKQPCLFMNSEKEWTGWGVFPRESMLGLPFSTRFEDVPKVITTEYKKSPSRVFLNTQSPQQLFETNARLIQSKSLQQFFLTTAKNIEKGIWISRAVTVHPSVTITPPVFIGENCQLNEDVMIGPNAILEDHCIIDKGSEINNSLILSETYVGEALTIENSLVDHQKLHNLFYDSHITLPEEFLISEASHPSLKKSALKISSRLLAIVILVCFSPLFLLLLLFKQLEKKEVVKLPAEPDHLHWKTFSWIKFRSCSSKNPGVLNQILTHIPSLINIIKGEMSFVGISPRTKEELSRLDKDWLAPVLGSKNGLITLTSSKGLKDSEDWEQKIDDIYYAAHTSSLMDLSIAKDWLVNSLRKTSGRSPS